MQIYVRGKEVASAQPGVGSSEGGTGGEGGEGGGDQWCRQRDRRSIGGSSMAKRERPKRDQRSEYDRSAGPAGSASKDWRPEFKGDSWNGLSGPREEDNREDDWN